MHVVSTMAALDNFSSDLPVAMIGKTEPLLLRLPLELRQHIYAFILGPRRLINLSHVRLELDSWSRAMIYRPKLEKLRESSVPEYDEDIDDESEGKSSESGIECAHQFNEEFMCEWRTGILGVSRAVSDDVLDVLYGQNIFVANIHGEDYLQFRKFGAANLRRVRYLRIVARPMGISYGRALAFDPKLWFPLLEGLLQFCVVAQQPLATRRYYDAPTLEEDLCEWTTWLDPILKYFSTHLPKTTAVGLDADGRAETTAMMDKHFASGYQKARTLTGDLCFERGRYSRESGYWDSDGRDGCNFADGGIGDDWSD